MKIEAGQWWETRGGDRAHIRYVTAEEMEYPVFAVYRDAEGVLYSESLSKSGRYWGNTGLSTNRADLVKHLPDCTDWDWEPPKPVDPGEGWRLLEVGMVRQVGDEWLDATEWTPCTMLIGQTIGPNNQPVRRRIQPDVPADWKLIGGVPGGMLYFKPTEAT